MLRYLKQCSLRRWVKKNFNAKRFAAEVSFIQKDNRKTSQIIIRMQGKEHWDLIVEERSGKTRLFRYSRWEFVLEKLKKEGTKFLQTPN